MGGEDQEWRVSKASQSCMAIPRRTYCFWISLRIHYGSLCSCHKHIMGAERGEKWVWSQLEATLSFNISPHPPPPQTFFFFPSHPSSQPHLTNTTLPHQTYVYVCVCASVLSPQSLHGWIVAAARLPATGSSSGSPSLHTLSSLRCSSRGYHGQPTPSWGKTSSLSREIVCNCNPYINQQTCLKLLLMV